MGKVGIQLKDKNNNEVYVNPFPVGAIYMSVDSRNPSQIFGGTWVAIQGRFLIGVDSSHPVSSTGGTTTHYHKTKNHTLTLSEIPEHTHPIKSGYGDVDSTSYDSYRYQYWGHYSNSWKTGDLGAGSAGGSQAHNHGNTESESNIPPYFAVYIWRRTA